MRRRKKHLNRLAIAAAVIVTGAALSDARATDLLVSSSSTDNVLRYDTAGTFVGVFA